ncbi:hypothetical protein T492DRAFT_1097214 [Pavlovales sp. CCMP2436]|nr:hypothetical protein T492DRAFT_1097214 [Pavlovales sp. CCMP2436]
MMMMMMMMITFITLIIIFFTFFFLHILGMATRRAGRLDACHTHRHTHTRSFVSNDLDLPLAEPIPNMMLMVFYVSVIYYINVIY